VFRSLGAAPGPCVESARVASLVHLLLLLLLWGLLAAEAIVCVLNLLAQGAGCVIRGKGTPHAECGV
jgi:hypothetical protein